jgi:hypothetical protein
MTSMRILDLTSEQKGPWVDSDGTSRYRLSKGSPLVRPWGRITGVVVHQTACVFGPLAEPEKRYRRALKVACHALAFRDRVVALPNPMQYYVHHANALSDTTLGLEVEGRYSGLLDDPDTIEREDLKTAWKGISDPITSDVIDTAREALRLLVEGARANGAPIQHVYAHRQSSPSRRSDPGQGLWKSVVLEYGCPKLGLKVHSYLNVFSKSNNGNGRPIPIEWDPSTGVGKY